MILKHTNKVIPTIGIYKTLELYKAPPGKYYQYYGPSEYFDEDTSEFSFMVIYKTGQVKWLGMKDEPMADECWTRSRWKGPYPL